MNANRDSMEMSSSIRKCDCELNCEHIYDSLSVVKIMGRKRTAYTLAATSIVLCLAVVVLTAFSLLTAGCSSVKHDEYQHLKTVCAAHIEAMKAKFTPSSAHLRLLPPVGDCPHCKEQYLLLTSHANTTTNHATGVTVEKERLVIEFPGLYFIYCSVNHHRQNSTPMTDQCQQIVSYYYVHRHSLNNPINRGVLLQGAHTSCDSSSETSFTGGVFRLEFGDYIYVSLSRQGLLDYKKESSFLGLFMLGSKKGNEV